MNFLNRKERWIDCYNNNQKILLVGEGDFSFSSCLAGAFHTAKNMVATSYLDEDWLVQTHWTGVPHIEKLERLGCLLLYNVDVYKMHTRPILKKMKFDVIVFNFPHAGHYDYLRESDLELIQIHRELVSAFFRSASKMLREEGQVHIRHRDDLPYQTWDVVSLAGEAGLKLEEKVLFDKSLYPGYHHKRGGGINTNKTFPLGYAFTLKFALNFPIVDNHNPKNKDQEIRVVKFHIDEVCVSKIKGIHDDDDDHHHHHVLEMKDNEKNDQVHDVFEISNDVHDHVYEHYMKSDGVNVDLVVHELERIALVEEQHMKTGVNDDLNVHVVEMKHLNHKENSENDYGIQFRSIRGFI